MIPTESQIYQHRYGGIYIVDSVATHTASKERLVVYTHLYPFEHSVWARPYDEWCDGRFVPLAAFEVQELMARDRAQFQKEITAARQAAKS